MKILGELTTKQPFLSKSIRIITVIVCILPALFLASQIAIYGVDVPYWDQWNSEIVIFEKVIKALPITPSYLLSLHNECRPFFPRFIWWALAYIPTWDYRYNLIIAFLLACCTSLCLYVIATRTIRTSFFALASTVVSANILIFGMAQYENWLWGFQFILYIPPACLAIGMVILISDISAPIRWVACALLCMLATFSFTSGLFLWILFLVPLVAHKRLRKVREIVGLTLYGIIMALSLGVYFWDYSTPGKEAFGLSSIHYPIKTAQFFFTLLGNCLSGILPGYEVQTSAIVGVILILSLISATSYVLWRGRRQILLVGALPWLVIASYTLVCALAVTFGRSSLAIDEALSSRYATFSLYLPTALLFLGLLLWNHTSHKGVKVIVGLFVSMMLLMGLISNITGMKRMQLFSEHLEKGRIALSFVKILPRDALKLLFPTTDVVIKRTPVLVKSGRLNIHMITNKDLSLIEAKDQPTSVNAGRMVSSRSVGPDRYLLTGTALLPARNSQPDAVILAYNEKDHAIAFDYTLGPYFNVTNHGTTLTQAKRKEGPVVWIQRISLTDLPKRDLDISAWLFDAETGKAYRLADVVKLKRPAP